MSHPILVILEKEWADLMRHRLLLISMIVPAVLLLVLPFVVTVVIPVVAGMEAFSDHSMQQMMELLRQVSPEMRSLPPLVQFQIYLFRQFLLLLALVPVMGGLAISTFSIIGEKQARSLEPLLATPITTTELLIGKCLGAGLPAVALTWLMGGLYAVGMWAMCPPEVLPHVMDGMGVTVIFLISPLVALLGLNLGVVVSSRSNDPRTAQQIGVVVILPLIALFISQLRGLYLLTLPRVLVGALLLLVINAIILNIGVKLFERETILTRWK